MKRELLPNNMIILYHLDYNVYNDIDVWLISYNRIMGKMTNPHDDLSWGINYLWGINAN